MLDSGVDLLMMTGGWNVEGWDRYRARRGFQKAQQVLGVGEPVEGVQQSFVQEWLNAAERVGFEKKNGTNSTDGLNNDGAWIQPTTASAAAFICLSFSKPFSDRYFCYWTLNELRIVERYKKKKKNVRNPFSALELPSLEL